MTDSEGLTAADHRQASAGSLQTPLTRCSAPTAQKPSEHVPKGSEHAKNAFVPLFSVQWNTSKFSEHLDGYLKEVS